MVTKQIEITMYQKNRDNKTTVVWITPCHHEFHEYESPTCCISTALDRGVQKLYGSKTRFFVREHETFGHDFRGRVGSACPTGGTNLDELVWADFIA